MPFYFIILGANIGKAINDAMRAIEDENDDLKDILPKTYNRLDNSVLVNLLKTFNSIPMDIEGDAFGKIYEYFLGKFAMSEGQKGGEFFTPTPIVKLIAEIIEPYHGLIYDPACGSGGMFVQSAAFVERHKHDPSREISIYGQERVTETVRLCKMNLAVHGLAGDIRSGNSYYEDPHNATGKFDFVMANPPFNVDRVDKERIKDDAQRFPFGMPRADNANYLWIQTFYSCLTPTGRAGFVMHNSATDAEEGIREKLIIDENAIDIIIGTSPNLFYTVNLPCTLWFLDKTRNLQERKKYVLFIDAKDIYKPIDSVHREITDEQIAMLVEIIRSYRGVGEKPYQDVIGLCRRVSLSEIAEKGYSLNPKIYVESKGARQGELIRALEATDQLSELSSQTEQIKEQLQKELNIPITLDRGILTEIAKLLYKKWFVNHNIPNLDVPYEHWVTMPLRETIEYYIGGAWGNEEQDETNTEYVKVIRGTDLSAINGGEINTCPVRFIKSSQLLSRALQDGDILIEISGGGKDVATGRTGYISIALLQSSTEPVIFSNFCKLVRANYALLRPTILYLHLQHLYDEKIIDKYEVQSTGIKNFKFEFFIDEEKIKIPPLNIQDRFHSVISEIFRQVHMIGRMSELTTILRQYIPPDGSDFYDMADIQIL